MSEDDEITEYDIHPSILCLSKPPDYVDIKTTRFVVFASYGNDSVALIQLAREQGWRNVDVLYTDTGWAAKWWPDRVASMQPWIADCGFRSVILKSEGMWGLVQRKKGWPRQGIQFCTENLKVIPAQKWLSETDPELSAVCVVGVRREESESRAYFPIWRQQSPAHGGRSLYAPLAAYKTAQRDRLIIRAGFDPLPHRSKECFPCINSNRSDILMLANDEPRVAEIEQMEKELGFTGKGKPRTLFRPTRCMGAIGIREVVRWARSERGKFDLNDGTGGGNCDGGYCGT
jgi:3'-phosphoadenosine 5'-phosphosulfate sulfotransferase (PAPS reductase)/FAD synthetase